LRHFSSCVQLSWRCCMPDLDDMICVADMTWVSRIQQLWYNSCKQKFYCPNRPLQAFHPQRLSVRYSAWGKGDTGKKKISEEKSRKMKGILLFTQTFLSQFFLAHFNSALAMTYLPLGPQRCRQSDCWEQRKGIEWNQDKILWTLKESGCKGAPLLIFSLFSLSSQIVLFPFVFACNMF